LKKKTFGVLAALCVVSMAHADDCRPSSQYQVGPITFSKMDVEGAVQRLLAKTPFQLFYAAKGISHQVSADGVSGDLGTVLSALGDDAGFVWEQKDCRILIARNPNAHEPEPAAPPAPVWTIRQGERFSAAMTEWGKQAGWQVFWETGELESEMSQSFFGSFEDAATKIIEVLAGQGVPVRAVVYGGNKAIRIMEKK